MRLSWRHAVVLGGCVALLVPQVSDTSPAPPGVIYRHGVILTMDDAQPRAEAVAVRDGRILAVGTDDDVVLLAQLRDKGADVADETQDMDGVGRFGWVTDPEGNRIALWRPA